LVLVQHDQAVLVVLTRRPYDRGRVLQGLGSAVEKRTIGGRTVHVGEEGKAVWLAGRNLFVGSIHRQMKGRTAPLAEGNGGAATLARPARLAAAGRHAVVIGCVPSEAVRGERAARLLRLLPCKPLLAARTATLLVQTGDGVGIEAQLTFADASAAAEGQ